MKLDYQPVPKYSPEPLETSSSDDPRGESLKDRETRAREAAENAFLAFRQWDIEESESVYESTKILQDATPHHRKIIEKRKWMQDCLRKKYQIYVQKCVNPRSTQFHGTSCEHPNCLKEFIRGQYRISVEPAIWTQPAKGFKDSSSQELSLDENFELRRKEFDEPLAIPNYAKLRQDVNTHKYGCNSFFCLPCFEDLLEPVSHLAQDPQSEVLSSRLYSFIFPENRVSLKGSRSLYALEAEALTLVCDWKECMYEDGLCKLETKYEFLGTSMTKELKEKSEGKIRLQRLKYPIEPGMNLANTFDLFIFKNNEAWKNPHLFEDD